MTRKQLSRRDFVIGMGLATAGAVAAACGKPTPEIIRETVETTVEVEKIVEKTVEVEKIVEVEAPEPTGPTNAIGEVLPADALPLEEQVIITGIGTTGGGYGHIMESLYNRAFEHEAFCQVFF